MNMRSSRCTDEHEYRTCKGSFKSLAAAWQPGPAWPMSTRMMPSRAAPCRSVGEFGNEKARGKYISRGLLCACQPVRSVDFCRLRQESRHVWRLITTYARRGWWLDGTHLPFDFVTT